MHSLSFVRGYIFRPKNLAFNRHTAVKLFWPANPLTVSFDGILSHQC
jgi:hypothetical protein